MKVIKTMKKLKFWSKKKKKKKMNFAKSPPSCDHCCCKNNHEFQPSAPPLPPSYYEQIHEASYASAVNYHTFSDNLNDFQYVIPSERNEIAPEIQPLLQTLPVSGASSSYQQYMVSNPVYGVPVNATTGRKERSFGGFGCVFNVGVHLIRIACPCFRIKEAY